MGDRERNELIGRAFEDSALLQRLLAAKDLDAVIREATGVKIKITKADAATLVATLKGPGTKEPGITDSAGDITFLDVIDAIGKAKSRIGRSDSGRLHPIS